MISLLDGFDLPIPKGIKCSDLSSLPASSRKRPGLNVSGSSHTVGSLWTDHRFVMTTVPLGIVKPLNST